MNPEVSADDARIDDRSRCSSRRKIRDLTTHMAAALLVRYSGRTLDAYRHDLRIFCQWASDTGVEVLVSTIS